MKRPVEWWKLIRRFDRRCDVERRFMKGDPSLLANWSVMRKSEFGRRDGGRRLRRSGRGYIVVDGTLRRAHVAFSTRTFDRSRSLNAISREAIWRSILEHDLRQRSPKDRLFVNRFARFEKPQVSFEDKSIITSDRAIIFSRTYNQDANRLLISV